MSDDPLLKYEVMDRASVQMHQFETALGDHHGLTEATRIAYATASEALGDFYQLAASEYWKSVEE